MATYSELYTLGSDAALLERVAVAVAIKAREIMVESADTPYHKERKKWAREATRGPDYIAKQVIWALLAQYEAAEVFQIQGSADSQILGALNAVFDSLLEI